MIKQSTCTYLSPVHKDWLCLSLLNLFTWKCIQAWFTWSLKSLDSLHRVLSTGANRKKLVFRALRLGLLQYWLSACGQALLALFRGVSVVCYVCRLPRHTHTPLCAVLLISNSTALPTSTHYNYLHSSCTIVLIL